MVILDTTTKVLIIGSGLSGPALAQILRKANVQFEIFERDTGKRPQGWAIGLDQCVKFLEPEKYLANVKILDVWVLFDHFYQPTWTI